MHPNKIIKTLVFMTHSFQINPHASKLTHFRLNKQRDLYANILFPSTLLYNIIAACGWMTLNTNDMN